MNCEKNKQILLSVTAIVLIIIGSIAFKDTNVILENNYASRDNELTFGDVELVNAEPDIVSNDDLQEFETNIVSNDELIEKKREENDYFGETKIERDKMYSEMIDVYQKIISNVETPEDQKSIAAQEINNITKIKNQIMISENLIMNKGFSDVVILVNNGNIDVVVEIPNLKSEDIAKIQNIVTREFDVELKNINISNK